MLPSVPSVASLDMAGVERESPGPLEHVQGYIEEGQWRKDRATRLRTPIRRAILDVENAPEKRKLRKNQQILSDLSRRVREHEVQVLSDSLSASILPRLSPRYDVFLRAHTTTPATPFAKSRATTTTGERTNEPVVNPRITTTESEHFHEPLRMEASFTRFGGLPGSTQRHKSFSGHVRSQSTPLEHMQSGLIRFSKGVHFANSNNRNRLIYSRDINGPVQLHLYTQRRANMKPLVVRAFRHDLAHDLNHVETFVNSRQVPLSHKHLQKPHMYSTLRCNPRSSSDQEISRPTENPISSW